MTRIDAPNSLADPDAFFEALVALHDGLDVEQSLALVHRHLLGVVQRRERPDARAAQLLVVEEDARDDERACE